MKNLHIKKTLFTLVAGAILILATLAACAPASQTEPTSPAAGMSGEIQRISIEESKTAFENSAAIFLDVRSKSSYAAGHIPGAVSIPLAELEARISELDSEQWIITYCT